MPKINVVKQFMLNREDGTRKLFTVGTHDVSKEIADHWFVKAHIEGAKSEPAPGSHEEAVAERAKQAEAEQKAADEAKAQADKEAADRKAAEAAAMEKINQNIVQGAQQAQQAAEKADKA